MLFESHLHQERHPRGEVSHGQNNGGEAPKSLLPPEKTKMFGQTLFFKRTKHQSSPQTTAFEQADAGGDDVCFVLQHKNNRYYGSAKDASSLHDFYKRIPSEHRSLYSIDRSAENPDQHSMLYFDIEWTSFGPCPVASDRLDLWNQLVSNALEKIGITGPFMKKTCEFSRPKSNDVYKMSFHVFFYNVYFETNVDMKDFLKTIDVSDPLLADKNGKCIIDFGVYTRNRALRLPGSHKEGESQRLEFPLFTDFSQMLTVGKKCPN